MAPQRAARERRGPAGGRRASHSMESVLTESVALLDEAGESALTFRALAARLGGGVASVYWYVANRDELLDRATDHVLAQVLIDTEKFAGSADPLDDIRDIARTLFGAMVERPWLAAYFLRNSDVQPNALALYERIGQCALRLKLSPRDTFHAVSAVTGFVVGIAADMGQAPPQEFLDSGLSRDDFIEAYADKWRQLDAGQFPFLHYIADEFAHHDDADQFRAGLDLLLEGLRRQAAAGVST